MTTTYQRLVGGNAQSVTTLEVSTGAPDANKIASTGPDGTFDPSLLARGVAPYLDVTAGAALTAGQYVTLYLDTGALRMRAADATLGFAGVAHGFVAANVIGGAVGRLYFSGVNDSLAGLTIAAQLWLGAAGAPTEVAPSTAGHISQQLGTAVAATSALYVFVPPTLLS